MYEDELVVVAVCVCVSCTTGSSETTTELAKLAAAACMPARERVVPPGMLGGWFGKLNLAELPRRQYAAASKALAAFSAESYEPSQILSRLFGSRISDTHFPHFLFLTPLYFGSCIEEISSLVVVVVVVVVSDADAGVISMLLASMLVTLYSLKN
ncbi:hypothetical protein HanIR_Chr06g0279571 [Helianthus annuus]|nr:hypothetical protein HanIR_Chr06g0279571 [Helianthus annuus]